MYIFWIVAGLLACWLCLLWQSRKETLAARTATLTTALAAVLGLVMAKLVYVAMFLRSTLAIDGLWALVETRANTFSLFGAVAGMMLGAFFSAKLLRVKPAMLLDRFIPCAALMLAFLRAGEGALGTIGVGGFVPAESWFARFPFAVTNTYGEHLYAVFRLEALIALVCAAALLVRGKEWKPGMKTELGLCFLALGQIICESLRARCMKWGFVRVEQLLCGILVLALIAYACRRMRSVRLRYLPVGLGVGCIGVVALMEYALDKLDIPVWGCYLLMSVALLVMAGLESDAVRKREK